MATFTDPGQGAIVLVDETQGLTVIAQASELRRINWFDGKLLRADDLRIEQDHARGLVRRANQAGGSGVVHGFACRITSDGALGVGPGLAIDPTGRSLLLPVDVSLDVQELIDRTAASVPTLGAGAAGGSGDEFAECTQSVAVGEVPVGGGRWYVITVGWAEALCGTEDVYGRVCEDACLTASDRPWRLDGLVFRAHPVELGTALATSTAVALSDVHERSLLAAALFADELAAAGSLISAAGLGSAVWCAGAAAPASARDEVPLAILARAGGTTRFLDLWTARRERIEPPPQRYWAGRVAMRPWDVFLAQVLQFQCQLSDLGATPPTGPDDPCAERQAALEELLATLEQHLDPEDPELAALREKVAALAFAGQAAAGGNRILVDGGIVELPPAGYLPVDPAGPPSIPDQVKALLGDGVNLTFCTTRHDAVARYFADAQHLERISLLRGLDDPAQREDVEIIVPDAQLGETTGTAWAGEMLIPGRRPQVVTPIRERIRATVDTRDTDDDKRLPGAGRFELQQGYGARWAGIGEAEEEGDAPPAIYLEADLPGDPFALIDVGEITFTAAADVSQPGGRHRGDRVRLSGTFRSQGREDTPTQIKITGTVDAEIELTRITPGGVQDIETNTYEAMPFVLMRNTATAGGVTAMGMLQFDEDTRLLGAVQWAGEAEVVKAILHEYGRGEEESGDTKREVVRMTFSRNDAVAETTHPNHVAAEQALAAVEAAIDELGYADQMRPRLFGEGAGSDVQTTRDWVLFRRRAVLDCGGAPPAAPVATETFAVYAIREQKPVLTHVPAAGQSILYLGEVAFSAGSEQLLSGGPQVLAAWRSALQGGEIPAAAVVAGAPGGVGQNLQRLDRVVDVLAAESPRGDDYQTVTLNPGQFALDPHGADGVFAVGHRPVSTQEVPVAVFAVADNMLAAYHEAIDGGSIQRALIMLFEVPIHLGTVRFVFDSNDVIDQSEIDAMAAAFDDQVNRGLKVVDTLAVAGDPTIGSEQVREDRVGAVCAAIGHGAPVRHWEGPEDDFAPARDRGFGEMTFIVLVPG